MTTNVKVELFYDGVWNTVPAYSRDAVAIAMGRTGESTDTPPSSASFTIGNRTTSYNPAYPGSLLWGKAGRYTPCRITIGSEVYELEAAKWVPGRSIEPISGTRGDAWLKVTAAGIRRRLGQGKDPKSALRRTLFAATPLLYYPFEDGANATQVASGLVGGSALTTDTVTFAATDNCHGSLPYARLRASSSTVASTVQPIPLSGITKISVAFIVSGALSATAPHPTNWDAINIRLSSGFTFVVSVYAGYTGGARTSTFGIDAIAATNGATTFGTGLDPYDGEGHAVLATFEQVGADVLTTLTVDGVTDTGTSTGITMGTPNLLTVGTLAVGTLDAVTVDNTDSTLSIGHLAVWGSTGETDPNPAATGYIGEDPGDRFDRLCTEEGITHTTLTASDASVPMGRQYAGTVLDLFSEIERTDSALIVDSQTGRGLTFYPGPYVYNRTAALTINFNSFQLATPTLPVLDDKDIRNDITLTRRDGATVHVEQTTGPSNTQDPTDDPQGIGRITDRVTINPETDDDLGNMATWQLHVKTFDGMRCPQVTVDMVATPSLAIADIGDRITITNLPADIGPPTLDLLVIGRTDTATPGTRLITYTTIPFDPYRVLQIANGADNNSRIPAADGATLTTGSLTTSGTSVGIQSSLVPWIDSTGYASQFPFDIVIDGEQMTVTANAGATLSQTMTVTRSVNGVVKTHNSGATVQLFRPPVVAL